MAKVKKDAVFLVSSAGTSYFYTHRKNRKKIKGESKMSLRKYDPVLRKHVKFEEKKLSKRNKKAAAAPAAAPNAEQAAS